MITDNQFKKLKPGAKVIVYDEYKREEVEATIDSIGGYCVQGVVGLEKHIYYKEDIRKIIDTKK